MTSWPARSSSTISFGPVREYGRLQRRYFEPPVAPTDQPYDVIIVGSGIGGGILADESPILAFAYWCWKRAVCSSLRTWRISPGGTDLIANQVIKHIWELWGEFQCRQYEKLANNDYDGAYGFNLGGRSLFWGASSRG